VVCEPRRVSDRVRSATRPLTRRGSQTSAPSADVADRLGTTTPTPRLPESYRSRGWWQARWHRVSLTASNVAAYPPGAEKNWTAAERTAMMRGLLPELLLCLAAIVRMHWHVEAYLTTSCDGCHCRQRGAVCSCPPLQHLGCYANPSIFVIGVEL
jgi:hypothetical protein